MVECPACEGSVNVPDHDGHYRCPLCKGVFDFDGSQKGAEAWQGWIFWSVLLLFIALWAWGMLTWERVDCDTSSVC